MRKEVNKPMLRPRTINAYIPAQEQVASDLVGRIKQLRDGNGEVPKLMEEINQYTMEGQIPILNYNRDTQKLISISLAYVKQNGGVYTGTRNKFIRVGSVIFVI